MYKAQYDENSVIGATFLRRSTMRRQDELKLEHKSPIKEDCYIYGKLLDSIDCKILLDTGPSKSFMSKPFI